MSERTVISIADSEAIARRVSDTLWRSVSPNKPLGTLLDALAMVAPAEALGLLAQAEDAFAQLTTNELSLPVGHALRAFDAGDPERRTLAAAIAVRYADRLTAEAVSAVIDALGTIGPDVSADYDRMRHRFPNDKTVLRSAAALETAAGDARRLDATLIALADADPTPGTMASIARLRARVPHAARPAVRAALLSSYTIDSLVPYLDHACRAIGLDPELYVAPFNSWTREVIDETSGLRSFSPEIVFLSVAIDDLVPDLVRTVTLDDLQNAGTVALDRVLVAARAFTGWAAGVPLVVHSFHSAFTSPIGVLDDGAAASRSAWLAQLNAQLAQALRALPSCYLLDVPAAVTSGSGSLHDNPKLRHLASMRLPPGSLRPVADAYVRYIAPLKGMTRKCVVLDLDNTLWGGVVGEDLKGGLRLGHSSPGSEFVEFQEYLRSLAARGIVLAINSKNNPDEALDVIRSHESMVLRECDFSAVRINWNPKPDNMLSIAQELNIGVDSLVFVDDNPDERERMRQLLPNVLTVELPKDPALYRATLERLPQLQALAITDEDRVRADQYRTARLREEIKLSATSIEDYLASLQIDVDIRSPDEGTFARIAQLFSRTNQFNTTTRRYSAADVAAFATDPATRLWIASSKDRFGDHGLIAVALVRTEAESWTIDSFLMSCRVIGYGVESTVLAHIAGGAEKAGVPLFAEFIETKKNEPARDLFARHGFDLVETIEGMQRWRSDGKVSFPSWITRHGDES